jgi:hypothetical protein
MEFLLNKKDNASPQCYHPMLATAICHHLSRLELGGGKRISRHLAVGSTGIVCTVSPCPETKKKQTSQGQATNYGDKACYNRMPVDAAEREIDHGAD